MDILAQRKRHDAGSAVCSHQPRMRRLAFGLGVLVAASMAFGCGGKLETTSDVATSISTPDATVPCASPQSTSDPIQNCALYCGFGGCMGCGPSVEECETFCEDDYAMANATKQLCLACAVDNIGSTAKVAPDFCEHFLSPDEDGIVQFTLTIPTWQCGSVCGP
jgi:hypothetical protein